MQGRDKQLLSHVRPRKQGLALVHPSGNLQQGGVETVLARMDTINGSVRLLRLIDE